MKILAPGFYARQDMATPVKIAFATVLVSQTLAVILMFPLGHAGLTLSTSIGACFNAALLFWFLRKHGVYVPRPGWLLFVSKLVIALFVLAAVLLWLGGPASFWLAASLWPKVGRLARRLRGRRRRLFRRAVAAGVPARRFQSPRRRGRAEAEPGRLADPPRGDAKERLLSCVRVSCPPPLAIRAARLHAFGVQIERVLADLEAALPRDGVLPLFDPGVVELLDATALQADEMVVMVALVQLEHRLAGLEMMADEQARLLELRQHPVDGGEPDVEALARGACGRRPRR